MIGILTLDTSEITEDAVFRKNYEEMPEIRREKIDRLHFRKDQLLSLGAGVLLKRALKETGFEGKDENLVYDQAGRPLIPSIDEHFKFSLSHSGTQVMCVYTYEPEGEAPDVGCDVEEIVEGDLRIAERFFTKEENLLIQRKRKAETKSRMFCRLWTLKESFLKVTGRGMALPLSDFSINIETEGKISICQHFDERAYHFEEVSFKKGYCYAFCVVEK